MSHLKEIRWLLRQLPGWVDQGFISPEQAEKLHNHYAQEKEGPDLPVAGLIAGILGALLIGGGIILIVAYNWDDLSRAWRTVISFAPLLLGQLVYAYAFFRQRHSPGWIEGTATFLMLTLAATLALISQTYHIEGRPDTFLWLWLVLSIPLFYLRNATLPAIIFLIGSCSWAFQAPVAERGWYYLLLAAVIPHLYLGLRPAAEAIRRTTLGWAVAITVPLSWLAVAEVELAEYSLLGNALWVGLFYLGGQYLYDPDKSFWQRPWPTAGGIIAFILLMVLSYDINLPGFDGPALLHGKNWPPALAAFNFGVMGLLSAIYLFLLVRQAAHLRLPGRLPALLPVFILLFLLLDRQPLGYYATLLANLYLLGWGAALLYDGLHQRSMAAVNLGMFLILALAAARFFDTDWSPLGKGIAFVLLGLSFLGGQYWMRRQLKSEVGSGKSEVGSGKSEVGSGKSES